MKKFLFVLFAIALVSCADDEDTNEPVICPTDVDYTISFKFEATKDNLTIGFQISSQTLAVDWGDNLIEDFDAAKIKDNKGEYSHTYSAEGTYTVRLVSNDLYRLDLHTISSNVSELNIGKCPALAHLNVSGIVMDKLVVSDCPKLSLIEVRSCPNLTSIDVSTLSSLIQLNCDDNKLTELKLNDGIWMLNCSNNELKNIDISKQKELLWINCENNKLEVLDISNNPNLETILLFGKDNKVKSLDLTNKPKLKCLECQSNGLASLDVSNSPLLETLKCSDNQIEELDLTKNEKLIWVDCSYNSIKALSFNTPDIRFVSLERNHFDKDALENIFDQLPQVADEVPHYIICTNNPGSACDSSIATQKGWKVTTD